MVGDLVVGDAVEGFTVVAVGCTVVGAHEVGTDDGWGVGDGVGKGAVQPAGAVSHIPYCADGAKGGSVHNPRKITATQSRCRRAKAANASPLRC